MHRHCGTLLCCLLALFVASPSQANYPRGNYLLQHSPALNMSQRLDWAVGRSFATQAWVAAPASTTARDGLGPLFNANRCTACHLDNGQGQLPEHGPGLILKLPPDSRYGIQLQTFALPGHNAEGQIAWTSQSVTPLPNSQPNIVLPFREYRYTVRTTKGEPSGEKLSARLAPALVGMGLIERIDRSALRASADPKDSDGDGISGRANIHNNAVGLFGWKAAEAHLRDQIALAFAEDMGIASLLHRQNNCPPGEGQCGNDTPLEIDAKLLDAVTDYIAKLALPPPPPRPPKVFFSAGCHLCHTPRIKLQNDGAAPAFAQAYSDFLLHDMGPGLAAAVGEGGASATEWRTAPLWGLALRVQQTDVTRLLHDGRARSIDQAILWHGGEGSQARQSYLSLSDSDRQQLIQFLQAL